MIVTSPNTKCFTAQQSLWKVSSRMKVAAGFSQLCTFLTSLSLVTMAIYSIQVCLHTRNPFNGVMTAKAFPIFLVLALPLDKSNHSYTIPQSWAHKLLLQSSSFILITYLNSLWALNFINSPTLNPHPLLLHSYQSFYPFYYCIPLPP